MPASPLALTRYRSDGSYVDVRLVGGHVASWRAATGDEVLYLSPLADPASPSALRGGIPVVFPQFANLGSLPKHGFARTARWQPADPEADDTFALTLADDVHTQALWPHAFRLTLGVRVAARRLRVALRVDNTGDAAFAFTAALHAYLRVANVDQVRVAGLEGARYRDKTQDDRHAEQSGPLRVDRAVDSVYENAPDRVTVREGERRLEVSKTGFADWVVWNPWREGAAALADLPDDDYRRMLCVEAAQVSRPITVEPGARWTGEQAIAVGA